MLYSYTISENFLKELSNLKPIDQHKICDFIRSNFIDKENLYLKMDRKVLTKKYAGLDNTELKDLIQTLSNNIKDVFAKKTIPIDIALCNKSDKFPVKIDCKLILENGKKIKEDLKKRIKIGWPSGNNEKNVDKLKLHLKRILSFNSVVVFNYRYLIPPLVDIAENIELNKRGRKIRLSRKVEIQLKGYMYFLELLKNLRNYDNKIKFYTTINPRHDKIAKSINFDIEKELKRLSNLYFKKNDEFVIKEYDHDLWSLLHTRLLITYLDDEKDFLEDDLNVFGHEGLDFLMDKDTIKKGKMLWRHNNDFAQGLWENTVKIVNKYNDFYKVVA